MADNFDERNAERLAADKRGLTESTREHPDAATKWYRRRIAGALDAIAKQDIESARAQLLDALDWPPGEKSADATPATDGPSAKEG